MRLLRRNYDRSADELEGSKNLEHWSIHDAMAALASQTRCPGFESQSYWIVVFVSLLFAYHMDRIKCDDNEVEAQSEWSRLVFSVAGLSLDICWKGKYCRGSKLSISLTDPFSETTPTEKSGKNQPRPRNIPHIDILWNKVNNSILLFLVIGCKTPLKFTKVQQCGLWYRAWSYQVWWKSHH